MSFRVALEEKKIPGFTTDSTFTPIQESATRDTDPTVSYIKKSSVFLFLLFIYTILSIVRDESKEGSSSPTDKEVYTLFSFLGGIT